MQNSFNVSQPVYWFPCIIVKNGEPEANTAAEKIAAVILSKKNNNEYGIRLISEYGKNTGLDVLAFSWELRAR